MLPLINLHRHGVIDCGHRHFPVSSHHTMSSEAFFHLHPKQYLTYDLECTTSPSRTKHKRNYIPRILYIDVDWFTYNFYKNELAWLNNLSKSLVISCVVFMTIASIKQILIVIYASS